MRKLAIFALIAVVVILFVVWPITCLQSGQNAGEDGPQGGTAATGQPADNAGGS